MVCRFGCKVKRVTMTGVGGYMVTFVHSQNGSMDLGVMLSDYLVVCIGLHSTPYVPAYRVSSTQPNKGPKDLVLTE